MEKNMGSAKKRVASVEWIRFYAATCVILCHFEALYFGENVYFGNIAIVVDFFFLVSGFLLMKDVFKKELSSAGNSLTDSFSFVFRKAEGFYAPYILAFAMTFILKMVAAQITNFGEIATRLFHFKWEALLLQMAGFNPSPMFGADYLVGSAWYLSAMLLAMLPVYYLASNHRHIFIVLLAPISALSVYCYIIQAHGTMDVGNEIVGFVMLGTLRAFAGLCIGCICFAMYDKMNGMEWTQKRTAGLGILEGLCFLSLPCLIILQNSISKSDTLFWILIFSVLIVLCFTGKTPIARILNAYGTNVGLYLGRLSLYIYLFHWFFVLLFVNYIPGLSYWSGQLLYCLCVFSFSMVGMIWFNKKKNRRLALR